MRVRRVVATCLAGAVGVAVLPASGFASQAAPSAVAPVQMAAPAAINWSTVHMPASLKQLLAEVNSRWPGRSRASDGWLGDAAHQRNKSDHNPVGHPNGPAFGTRGSVHGLDVTSSGIDATALVGAILGDSRVGYVIYNRTIWSRTYGWAARPYYGDSHLTHVHISLRSDSRSAALAAERNAGAWLGKLASSGTQLTTNQVRALQKALIGRGFAIPAGATGTYGSQTKAAVAAFQRSQGWRGSGADGIAGRETLRRLGIPSGGATVAFATPTAARKAAPAPAAAPASSYLPGVRGSHVAAMQKALIARGFAIKSGATGMFGSETRSAVAAFQRAQGWSGSGADGIPGSVTLNRLGLSSAKATTSASTAKPSSASPKASPAASSARSSSTASASYAPGARGDHIVWLQRALLKNGYTIGSGATGWFGPETQRAVAAFQRAQGWSGSKADGVPGRVTLVRLGLG